MKNDSLLIALVNFLVPVIALYGLFFLLDFFDSGFFSFVYAVILLTCASMIFLIRFPQTKISALPQTEFLSFFVYLMFSAYFISILLLITNLFEL